MFIRSENLFLRPAWAEDRRRLDRLGVPSQFAPGEGKSLPCERDNHHLVVTLPHASGRIVGTAELIARVAGWQQAYWLAPAYDARVLVAEVERNLAMLANALPPPVHRQIGAAQTPDLMAA